MPCQSRHMFYIQIEPTTPRQKSFSPKKEIFRQIIRADIEEDKNRKVKEYLFNS
jgi:hypothetical protein